MRQKSHIFKIRVGILIFFLFPFRCFSQDISGVWVGNMYNDTTQQNIHYELAINDVNGKTNGFSHTTFIIDSVKNIGVKEVKVKVKKDRVFVEDEKFVFDNYTEPPAKGVKMYSFLTLSHNDSSEVLAGTWRTNATREYSPLTGSIFLEKKKKVQPEQTIIVKKLIDIGLADQLAFLPPSIASQNTVAINEKKQKQSVSNPSSSSSVNEQPITASPVQPSAKEGNEKTVAINEQQTVSKNNLSSPVTTTPKPEAKNEEINLAAKNKIDTNQGIQPSAKEGNEKTVSINEQQTVSKNNLSSSVTTTPKPEAKIDAKGQSNNEVATIEKPAQSQIPPISNNQVSSSVQQKISKNSELKNGISRGNETDKKVVADNSKTSAENKNEPSEKQLAANQKINSTAVKEEKQNANAAPKPNTEITSPVINKEVTKDFPENEKKKEVVASASENEPKNEKISQDVTKQKINSLQLPVVVKPKVVIPPPAAEFSKRELETIRTVEIAQDSLVFSLYDNGTVDGDTVSVLLNGQVIMPRVGLLVTAISKTIYLTPEMGDSISVVMYAENLGSIPPNTGLLVIHDGARIYEIRFSGDLSKNSKIILIRKKKT